ncbi:MAG: Sec-independent protein translocase, TatC subunit [Verrucomicrobiales bacterium]|nr:Sec-independent protein translocase, TatC subunit [Verrucomicrobiales bacterium]
MADDYPDVINPEEQEVAGGAVKTFLEHLEDLRWTLVKSGAALLLGLLVCLFAAPQIMQILTYPLKKAGEQQNGTNQTVYVKLAGNSIGSFDPSTNTFGSIDLRGKSNIVLDLVPTLIGTQQVMTVNIVTNAPQSSGPGVIILDPGAAFMLALQLGLFGGLILACPFVLYFLGQFVMPALKIKEKKYFLQAFFIGLLLFFSGVSLGYFWIMPKALNIAQQFANWMGIQVPNWRAETLISFEVKFLFGMGIGFEMPVVLLALVKIGFLNYTKLAAMRRYMIVANLILGALLTTPEVYTQVVMCIILQILYEISVWIAWYWEYRDRKREVK